ncbi:hypothetical protein T281_07205 [Rhodomicrobium udaipurense JA643]|uniref:Uncharacterized protein n=1 Tax=Rhodomicrobium udaipurense TaxID=1202716 RepID=A0A8I1GAA9_9HYPH|nr:hypothetical protein [Rhodomicrobium udaipurense]KAI95098.1 hypothetical protein T281_07205 [Rhodomicrobium udaipurense JA643]MBJ7542010.1 hypothetical protein [Rhodomicrobium udaipurense]
MSNTLPHPTFGETEPLIRDLIARAPHLINPRSGIANDFINQYNEALLLLENLPVLLPEMIDELLAWKPKTYVAYFESSPLSGGDVAIRVYELIDDDFRSTFEKRIAVMNAIAQQAIYLIRAMHSKAGDLKSEQVECFCRVISKRLRIEIEKAVDLINHGGDEPKETSQVMADRLMATVADVKSS